MDMQHLPIITGEKVVLRPITDADTDRIVAWRNTPSVMQNFIFRQKFTPEMHRDWLATKVAAGRVVQYIIEDKAAGRAVGSVYFRDVDPANHSAEYGIFIGEESAAVKALAPRPRACLPRSALRSWGCTASACACWPATNLRAAAMKTRALP